MAYRALYRTYRPKVFSEVVGQEAVVKTLQNALSENKIAHAYLFSGPRGTGKTTMARLFAKALNCSEGLGHECNKCDNCTAILEGRHPDVFEIDAASNSGVDNVRRLIDQVSFAPILGRYKVYIIDEVHSMSSSAFNALLKTLEEPPANVVFILATTEPDKVLPTILSRVQRFDFTKISDKGLVSNMENILSKEGIGYDEDALYTIARLSQGGARDSLSLLDQAISYSGKTIHKEDVNAIFGLMEVGDELELVRLIHLNDVKGALSLVKDKYNKGADILKLHNDLINIYKDLLIFGTTKDPSLLSFLNSQEALRTLVTPMEIRKNLDILISTRREYKNVINAFDLFQLTVIELASNDVSAISVPEVKREVAINVPSAEKPIKKEEAVVQPTPTPVTPAPVIKEEEPHTITSSTLEKYNDIVENGEELTLTLDQVLNIMVQGDKQAKTDLMKMWDAKLNSVPKSDTTGKAYIAANLAKCTPVIFAPGVVVVESNFRGITKKINLLSNQDKEKSFMKEIFGLDIKVVALYHPDYIDYVKAFMDRNQAGNLPSPTPIVFNNKKEEEKKPTNAELFIDSLKSEK